jgi:hypothetical protein
MQTRQSFRDPPLQDFIDPGPCRLHVQSNSLAVPALRVQLHNRSSPLKGVRDLPVGQEAPRRDRRPGSISQDAFDGMRTGFASKAHKANRSNLMGAKGGIVGLEIDDQLAHVRGKTARSISSGLRFFGEEAGHASFLKLHGFILQRPFARPGFFGSFRGALVEEDNGAQQFIDFLLGVG